MTAFWDQPQGEKGERLKEEFDNLGWSEKEARSRLMVAPSRLATMLHGSFKTVPGEVLERMAMQGIDIQYVLTGKPARVDMQESALLDNYRNSTPDSQAIIRKIGAALEKQDEDVMQRIITRG